MQDKIKAIAVFVKNLTSGGAEKQSVLLAKALAGDYDVHYIIFNGWNVHKKYMDMLGYDGRIHVCRLRGGRVGRFRAFVAYLKQNGIKAVFSYLTAANVYACMAGRMAGADVYTGLRNAELPSLKLMADRLMANYFAKRAIANCYSERNNFVSKGFKSRKVSVIPNCFENISPYSVKVSNSFLRIITVGRFVPQKDYETAIRAIAELKKASTTGFSFVIVGYGKLEGQVRRWVKEYGVDDCTQIFINPDNIMELLCGADIYLSTSIFEGTSNSIMEAMNANLPIVATNVGDNEYLVLENKNGYLHNVGDFIGISKTLLKLIGNEKLRQSLGRKSKNLLSENFSMDLFRQRYIQLLKGK